MVVTSIALEKTDISCQSASSADAQTPAVEGSYTAKQTEPKLEGKPTAARKKEIVIKFHEEDLPYEEELQRNPYSVKHWLRFIDHKKSFVKEDEERGIPQEERKFTIHVVHHLYERALLQMPMSYKLWNQYLKLRLLGMADKCLASPESESVNNTFEQ